MPRPGRSAVRALALVALAAAACSSGRDTSAHLIPPSQPRASSTSAENALIGSREWRISRPSLGQIAGYASATSIAAGETIRFHVSVQRAGTTFRIDVFRLGWYGGAGGRLVKNVTGLTGQAQGWWNSASGAHDLPSADARRMLALSWTPSYDLSVPPDWASGYYLAKLQDSSGFESLIPFVVRDDKNAHDFLVQASVTTWQSYNAWGGYSLYGHYDAAGKFVSGGPLAAAMVSYDRPFEDDNGAGFAVSQEARIVAWLESRGYDVAYVSDLDTHAGRPAWFPKAFLSIGHDEYWTREMRDGVTFLRARGVSLAFLGGNDVYWRTEVSGQSATGEPRQQTRVALWRDSPTPENELLGQVSAGVVSGGYVDWVITDPSHWLFEGTSVKSGDRVPTLVGYEADRVVTDPFTPAGLQVVAESPFVASDPLIGRTVSNTTIYRDPSGAWVFYAGTINWGAGLSADPRVRIVTSNLLDRFARDFSARQVERTARPTPTPSPTPEPPNANLMRNGAPVAAGNQQFLQLSAGTTMQIVADPASPTKAAYRFALVSASSQASSLPIAVDPAKTYSFAGFMRTEGTLQARFRIIWLAENGQVAGADTVTALTSSKDWVEVRADGRKPYAGSRAIQIVVVGTGAGTVYAAGLRFEQNDRADPWSSDLQR